MNNDGKTFTSGKVVKISGSTYASFISAEETDYEDTYPDYRKKDFNEADIVNQLCQKVKNLAAKGTDKIYNDHPADSPEFLTELH